MCPTRTAPTKTLTLALFYPTFSVGHPEKIFKTTLENSATTTTQILGEALAAVLHVIIKCVQSRLWIQHLRKFKKKGLIISQQRFIQNIWRFLVDWCSAAVPAVETPPHQLRTVYLNIVISPYLLFELCTSVNGIWALKGSKEKLFRYLFLGEPKLGPPFAPDIHNGDLQQTFSGFSGPFQDRFRTQRKCQNTVFFIWAADKHLSSTLYLSSKKNLISSF